VERDETAILVHCRMPRRYVRDGLTLLHEVITEPLITTEHVILETERLREEWGEEELSMENSLEEEFDRQMFGRNGVYGIGEENLATTGEAKARDLFFLHRRLFVGRRLALVLSGGFREEAVAPVIRARFSLLKKGSAAKIASYDHTAFRGIIRLLPSSVKKVVCILGFPTFGFTHPDRIALGLLRNHFSSRISSRLSVSLEARGIGYTTRDTLWMWHDVGKFSIYLSTFPEKFLHALRAIAEEVDVLRSARISSDDLAHAKANLAVAAEGRFSEPLEAATFYATQWVNQGTTTPLPRYLPLVKRVSVEDIRSVAKHVFCPTRLVVVACGALSGIPRRTIGEALAPLRRTA
jgi:predicted Zn-dependent peptidase